MDNRNAVLWQYYRSLHYGDRHNQKRLHDESVLANWGLVQKVARRMAAQCPVPFEDLCQIGYEGLSKAIARFDPTLGNRFSSLAVTFISGAILHYLRDHGTLVKIPRKWREDNARINKFERSYHATHGRNPPINDVAAALGLSVAYIKTVRDAIALKTLSINEELDSDDGEGDEIKTQFSETVSKLLTDAMMALERLPEQERFAVTQALLSRSPRRLVANQMSINLRELNQMIGAALDVMAETPPIKPLEVDWSLPTVLREIEQIRATGPVAPRGCWLERYQTTKKLASGDRKQYIFVRVRAESEIIPVGDRLVKRLHLATVGSPLHLHWQEQIERRRKINELERLVRREFSGNAELKCH